MESEPGEWHGFVLPSFWFTRDLPCCKYFGTEEAIGNEKDWELNSELVSNVTWVYTVVFAYDELEQSQELGHAMI